MCRMTSEAASYRSPLDPINRTWLNLGNLGCAGPALNPRPQPLRPDKVKIKGNVEQKLVQLACSDPPQGRCHWTLQLLADRLVVLGLLDTVSIETVRQALKKTTLSHGSWKR